MVRYHYLIRDIKKSAIENLQRHNQKTKIWDSLDTKMHEDLQVFLGFDDLGKGRKRR